MYEKQLLCLPVIFGREKLFLHSPLFYFISQRSDIGNGDFYDVAGMDELRRIEAYAYAGRRARGDDVAGQERRSL